MRLDRNFKVVLIDTSTSTESVLFSSADQSVTISAERFVWSPDSRYIALVGDRYFANAQATRPNGEIVFLLYDTGLEKLWCNSDSPFNSFPAISAETAYEKLRGTQVEPEWTE